MQAIVTKYLGPTNHRGSRVKAICAAGSLTIEVDNRWNQDQNHASAAAQLVTKLDWTGGYYASRWYSASLPDGSRVHVCGNEDESFTVTKDVTCIPAA